MRTLPDNTTWQRMILHHPWWVAWLLIGCGAVSIMGSYPLLSHTSDEPAHLAAGMEWWQFHRYTYEALHPPLARLLSASLLFWADKDLSLTNTDKFFFFQGADILQSPGSYGLHLILMRLPILSFYLISCLLVFSWSKSLFGVGAALLSLALYVTLPSVAAHAGLATTDMGNATMVMAGIMATLHWLKKPSIASSVLVGGVLALMVATKFSSLVYWPVAMLVIMLANEMARRFISADVQAFRIYFRHMAWALPVAVVFFLVIGVVYFFSYGDILDGIHSMLEKNKYGHATWLFHKLEGGGVWFFFPVVYFFKTPLAFLSANLLSAGRSFSGVIRHGHPVERCFPVLAALSIMAMSMPSNINLGVRHVLGMYPLLAVPAGYGLLWLWQYKDEFCRPLIRALLVGLVLLQAADFVRSYPDRLSYYNQMGMWLADGRPERISFDSDYDWGQDYLFLAKELKKHDVKEIYNCFWWGGFTRNMDETLRVSQRGCPDGKVTGWFVISRAETLWSPPERFAWLQGYRPMAEVGKTLLLYHIE